MTDSSPTVDKVQDTARWVAMCRALESERKDALFNDPYARKLAGPRGEELVAKLSGKAGGTWPLVARTWLVDRLVADAVRDGADAMLNLAAGLDSRPYRLELPPSFTWIEVDHADMIADKEALLKDDKPVCKVERMSVDLADEAKRQALLAEVGSRFKKLLVMTEGLLVYLPPESAMGLARDIRAVPSVFRWIADLNNKAVNDYVAKRTGNALQGTAAFKFGPPEGPLVFDPLGWRCDEATSIFKTAGRLKRLPFPLFLFWRFPSPKYGSPRQPWSGICTFSPKAL